MKKFIALIALTTLTVASAAYAQGSRYLVVLKSQSSYKELKSAVLSKDITYKGFTFHNPHPLMASGMKVESSLDHLNTFVVNGDDAEMKRLSLSSDIAFIEKEVFHPAPKPVLGRSFSPMALTVFDSGLPGMSTPWGINAVKAPQAWAASKYGAESRVLVLDTGIDKDHPALKENLEIGQDFVYDNNQPYPYFDGIGHGTHVAGTIAGAMNASTGFTGVAPKAKILMGRVCSAQGCSNISIASGINWGISKKVDVISMSLGGPMSTTAERQAVANAEKAGIVVVAASGNDGSGKVSFPAALPTVIAVGAVDANLVKAPFSQFGPELAIVAPGVSVASAVPMGTGRESKVDVTINGKVQAVNSTSFDGAKNVPVPVENVLVFAGLGKVEDFAKADVAGKFALIQRGEIKFTEKVQNAINAKAVGVVIFNNAPGLVRGALTEDGSELPVPVVMIEQNIGEALKASLSTGQIAKAKLETVATDYSNYDGTSMATPHVAGVVALMKSANKNLTPLQVRQMLKASATPLSPNTRNEYGAGMVNAEAAVNKALGH